MFVIRILILIKGNCHFTLNLVLISIKEVLYLERVIFNFLLLIQALIFYYVINDLLLEFEKGTKIYSRCRLSMI